MQTYAHLSDLRDRVGTEIGLSDWVLVDQARIDRFAQVTGDEQWIHIDAERAARGPYGTTIAHGFLTLSLLPMFLQSAIQISDVRMSVNYGLNRVRFPAPVPAGSRLRARLRLIEYTELGQGSAQLVIEATVEREGSDRPVCVAESVSRRHV
jgi:acyl dehydratase